MAALDVEGSSDFSSKLSRMSSVQTLRQFVNDRLASAAREIFEVFELTVSELEEEVDRQRKLLDGLLRPAVVVQRRDEQPDFNYNLHQESPEPPLDIEDEDDFNVSLNYAYVKSEYEEEEAESSQLYQGEEEPPASGSAEHLKTEIDNDDHGGTEPGSHYSPLLHSDQQRSLSFGPSHVDRGVTTNPLCGLNSEKKDDKSLTCAGCGRRCYSKRGLSWHSKACRETLNKRGTPETLMDIQTEQKSFGCSECGKFFSQRIHLKRHMVMHTGEKPFGCSHCGRSYSRKGDLKKHIRIHTGEKPFCCSHCGKRFNQSGNLTIHLRIHKREKPFCCPECGKGFSQRGHMKKHMTHHTIEKTGQNLYKCSNSESDSTALYPQSL